MMTTTAMTLLTWTLLSPNASVAESMVVRGFTEPSRQIEVAAADDGQVAEILVKEGERVRAGQTLARLETATLDAALRIARLKAESTSRAKATAAEMEQKQLRLRRLEELRTDGHANEDEVERARADATIAAANHEAAVEEQALNHLECEQIEAQIARRQVVSPIDGAVVRIRRDVAEYVTLNEPGLAHVAQLDPLQVTLYVSSPAAGRLSAGLTLPVTIVETQQRVSGRVDFVSPVTEPGSGTVRVKLLIDNPADSLRSGLACEVRLP
ncbi:MAG: efflux RND transporter periplasmic adaptor subunit [Planctomycetales bacterium]|nr:efflux RND transporter periplasmic adaptor subunit [Planctomycetales bacterium]